MYFIHIHRSSFSSSSPFSPFSFLHINLLLAAVDRRFLYLVTRSASSGSWLWMTSIPFTDLDILHTIRRMFWLRGLFNWCRDCPKHILPSASMSSSSLCSNCIPLKSQCIFKSQLLRALILKDATSVLINASPFFCTLSLSLSTPSYSSRLRLCSTSFILRKRSSSRFGCLAYLLTWYRCLSKSILTLFFSSSFTSVQQLRTCTDCCFS